MAASTHRQVKTIAQLQRKLGAGRVDEIKRRLRLNRPAYELSKHQCFILIGELLKAGKAGKSYPKSKQVVVEQPSGEEGIEETIEEIFQRFLEKLHSIKRPQEKKYGVHRQKRI